MPRIFAPIMALKPEAFNGPSHAVAYMRRAQPESMGIDIRTGRHVLHNHVPWNDKLARGITYLNGLDLLEPMLGERSYLIKGISL